MVLVFLKLPIIVSVPLRGLIEWKLELEICQIIQYSVSVPLRGLIEWKPRPLKQSLGADSRGDFGGPLKKPYFRLWVKSQLKLTKR